MCVSCISSINQHCFEGERVMLIKQSKKYCKCSARLLAEIVCNTKCESLQNKRRDSNTLPHLDTNGHDT